MKKIILPLLAFSLFATACKKKDGEEEKIGGCTDKDSPFYEKGLDFDDGTCKYAFVTEVEVHNFPELDNGSSWDWPSGKADIYFKLKPVSASDYTNYFTSESNDIGNATHNDVNEWTSATQFQLTNEDWYWELMDKDDTSADDVIATGTFNPLSSISTSTGVCSINHPNGTQIKLQLLFQ